MLELVTGGSGSGKSAYAESRICEYNRQAFILQQCSLMEKRQKRRLRGIVFLGKEKGLRH